MVLLVGSIVLILSLFERCASAGVLLSMKLLFCSVTFMIFRLYPQLSR